MDLSDIADIRIGARKISAVYIGADKLWPTGGGPEFQSEMHYVASLAGMGAAISGEPLQFHGWGWLGLFPDLTGAPDKIYLEYRYHDRGDGSGEFTTDYIALEDTVADVDPVVLRADGSIRSGDSEGPVLGSIGAVLAANLPATQRICVDRKLGRFWAALEAGDWNSDAAADPEAGTGGIEFDPDDLPEDAQIILMLEDGGSVAMAEVALHAHQFKYAAPAGFSEITVNGEYA